jgi:hypothetical protein
MSAAAKPTETHLERGHLLGQQRLVGLEGGGLQHEAGVAYPRLGQLGRRLQLLAHRGGRVLGGAPEGVQLVGLRGARRCRLRQLLPEGLGLLDRRRLLAPQARVVLGLCRHHRCKARGLCILERSRGSQSVLARGRLLLPLQGVGLLVCFGRGW